MFAQALLLIRIEHDVKSGPLQYRMFRRTESQRSKNAAKEFFHDRR